MASIDLETLSPIPKTAASSVKYSRADLGPVAILVASVVGMFWRILFTPALLFYRDICNYTYPSAQLIREIVRHGSLPYWNPYLNYGQPILANPNLLFFYPSTLFILYFPFDLAYKLHFVVHFCIAAVGTYLLARAWGQSYRAAFFAAFIFVFSGQVLSLGNFYNTVACCAWLPWALLATEHALNSTRLRPWILLTAVFALQWLAAEPFSMMATFVLSFAYAFYRKGDREKLLSPANFRLLVTYGAMGCAMLLLCAVQFLPSLDMLNNSHRRDGISYKEITTWSLSPLSLLQILTPNFTGSLLTGPRGLLWLTSDQNDPYNISDFLGFIPFFFALVGWAVGKDQRRNFLAGGTIILLLLSLGHFTPIFALARLIFPPLAVVRYPIKLMVHATLLIAILAGWGFDALLNAGPAWKAPRGRIMSPLLIVVFGSALILAISWLVPGLITSPVRWWLHTVDKPAFNLKGVPDYLVVILQYQLPSLVGFGFAALVLLVGMEGGMRMAKLGLQVLALLAMVQLVLVNFAANPTVPKNFYSYRPPVLAQFKAPPETFRFRAQGALGTLSDTPDLQSFVNFQSIPEAADLTGFAQDAFVSKLLLNTGSMYYRVDGSINIDPERSVPPFVYDVKIYLEKMKNDARPTSCLLGRTNVKYILRAKPAETDVTRFVTKVFNGSEVPSELYEDLCFVPRAYVAGNSLFTTNSEDTINRLASPDFDALNTAIIAAPDGSSPSVLGTDKAGEVEVVSREADTITLRANLIRPGYVLLLDRYDPNWHATLDGRETTIFRANQISRAVYAGAGEHLIRFAYRQKGLKAGFFVSIATFLCLLVTYFLDGMTKGLLQR